MKTNKTGTRPGVIAIFLFLVVPSVMASPILKNVVQLDAIGPGPILIDK